MKRQLQYSVREPYLLYLVLLGVGLGTITLPQTSRFAVLWSALAGLCIAYLGRERLELGFSFITTGRGALLGLVISLPLLAILAKQLRLYTERLYATDAAAFLYYQICFVAAPIEECFFRGIVQDQRGSSTSIALYAVTALVFFLPHVPLLAAFVAFLAQGLLGIVYSYVRDHYGLAASIACHFVVGFILQVVPSIVEAVRQMLIV